jgi:hypothetical protein
VQIDAFGRFTYVLVKLSDRGASAPKLLVRGKNGRSEAQLLSAVTKEVRARGGAAALVLALCWLRLDVARQHCWSPRSHARAWGLRLCFLLLLRVDSWHCYACHAREPDGQLG